MLYLPVACERCEPGVGRFGERSVVDNRAQFQEPFLPVYARRSLVLARSVRRAVTYSACPDNSVGQSVALVKRKSSVRIRLGAPMSCEGNYKRNHWFVYEEKVLLMFECKR